MTRFYTDDAVTLFHGDCLEVLASLPDSSVDSVVTDPPYGLGFMGREWDSISANHRPPSAADLTTPLARMTTGKGPAAVAFDGRAFQSWCELWATECLRVLKPGGHMLAFGGSRTWHRLTCAIEDAGFEIRDSIAWLYGSGFPKSLDVSKAIDKQAGAERGRTERPAFGGTFSDDGGTTYGTVLDGEAITPDAQRWQGWGTALKPAFEPIVVARKPLAGTVAQTVLAHGTGALNIDATRVGTDQRTNRGMTSLGVMHDDDWRPGEVESTVTGRWPSNVVLDESQAAELDRQSGTTQSTTGVRDPNGTMGYHGGASGVVSGHSDSGGASRFFPTFRYEPKAPTTERPRDGGTAHPTVKPLDLMRWLVRLVTPPGGTVLEPFAGSGTTAEACVVEGFKCVAIEREADYLPLIVQRLTKPIQVALEFD